MNRLVHLGLTVAVLLVFGGLATLLVVLRREPAKTTPPPQIPSVEVVEVEAEDIAVVISANGTVRARTTTQLTPQVAGAIIEVNSEFHEGGFFRKGDVLLRIDPVRYEMQLANARAQLATAKLALEREEALAKRNRREWTRLDRGEPTGLAANIPQLAKAQADVEAAQAGLKAAEHDLAHTDVVAPYTGRVRSKLADVGQSVSAMATSLAELYAIDYAEVVLPLPSGDAWFLDVPALGVTREGDARRIPVTLTGDLGGETEASWQGYIDRSTGLVDPNSRFVSVIVRVEDPYGLESGNQDRPPLQIGQFVRATVEGRVLKKAFAVPREAILPGDRVYVVTPGEDESLASIRAQSVVVGRKESDRVLVTSGLHDGEWVSVTRLPFVGKGMKVKPLLGDARRSPGQLSQFVRP